LAGLLNAHSRFWLPAISPGIRAGICIATIFVLKERFGIHSIAIGYIVGELARLAAFVFVLTRERIIFLKLDFDFDPSIISFFKVISFQIVCMITIGLNPVVDKAMASWLSTGSVSILQYADRINIIPIVFVSSGLIVVMLSRWSNLYYEYKNINVLRNDLRITLRAVLFISLAIVIVLFMFSKQLVSIAYARGKFPGLFIDPVRSAFLWYLIGTPFYLLGQVVVRAHLVLHNTKTLMITAFIANIFNIVLNLVLMYFFGVNGIAMSTSIVSIIMFLHLHRAFDQLVNKKLSTLGHAN
jgi:putative peptidoglycan lipid II flippase